MRARDTRTGWRVATLAAAACVALAIAFVDRPLSTYAHDVWRRPAIGVWLTWIADVPLPAAGIALAGGGAAFLAGWRPGARGRALLGAAVAVLAARAGADMLKLLFGRPWPETWIDRNPSWIGGHHFGFFLLHGGRGYASFPSGHTVDIAAPCAVLWRQAGSARPAVRRGLRVLAALLVAAVAGGLVVSDYHFASDVLAGAYAGIAIGYGVMASIAP